MKNLPQNPDASPIERESPLPEIALGQWYWVQSTERVKDTETGKYREEPYEWLGCVMHLGSNYVELHSPHSAHGYSTARGL